MGINIPDFLRRHAGIVQRLLQTQSDPTRFRVRLGHMVGIGAHAVADNLSVNGGTTALRLLEFFQHEHTRTFAQYEAVAPFIKGATRLLGSVVACRQGPHGTKSPQCQWRDRRFATTTQHHIRIATLDDFVGFTNSVGTSGTGGGHTGIGTAQTKAHADMPRGHIGDEHRHKKWRNALWPGPQEAFMIALERGHAAKPYPQQTPTARCILFIDGERCSVQSHGGTGQGKLGEAIHALHLFFVNIHQRIEVLHFPSNVTGILAATEVVSTPTPTSPLHPRIPRGLSPCPYGRHHPHACDPPPPVHAIPCHRRATPVCQYDLRPWWTLYWDSFAVL